jgi:hypothetical protein
MNFFFFFFVHQSTKLLHPTRFSERENAYSPTCNYHRRHKIFLFVCQLAALSVSIPYSIDDRMINDYEVVAGMRITTTPWL